MYRPQIETASRDLIQDLQLGLFRNQVRYVYANSPMYKQKYDAEGLKPEGIRTFDDITKVPFTTKEDLRRGQEENPPYGNVLCTPVEEGIRAFQTSGTTGTPVRVLFTARDWFGIACEHVAYQANGYGIKKTDIAFMPFGYGLFIAWWAWQAGLESLGVTVIPGGAQSSQDRIKNIIDWKATVILGTPTYILRLGDVAKDMGISLSTQSQVRLVVLGGEPGAQIPSTRAIVEETWGATCLDAIGATDMPVSFGFECLHKKGTHIIESMFLAEVVNPDTGEHVAQGEQGELVLTNLCMETMPLVRYRMRDVVRLLYDRCECGRTFVRMDGGVLGRVDDMINYAGVNIYPSAIENFVRSVKGFSTEFEVIVPKLGSKNRLTIKVEPASENVSEEELRKGIEEVTKLMKWNIGITPEIEVAKIGTLPRYELKARRVKKEG
jgi:phenylacetate-coenzyme A ligase PaaK-like adenylate-forming protein